MNNLIFNGIYEGFEDIEVGAEKTYEQRIITFTDKTQPDRPQSVYLTLWKGDEFEDEPPPFKSGDFVCFSAKISTNSKGFGQVFMRSDLSPGKEGLFLNHWGVRGNFEGVEQKDNRGKPMAVVRLSNEFKSSGKAAGKMYCEFSYGKEDCGTAFKDIPQGSPISMVGRLFTGQSTKGGIYNIFIADKFTAGETVKPPEILEVEDSDIPF